jgi:GNAT superfamily N-acetyltransferase
MRQVRIEKYKPAFKPFFKSLNQRWIEAYFKMEEADHIALNDPEGKVLSKGGEILFALVDEAVVGVCALVKLDASIPYDFELSKMGVDPAYQGLGIGYKLGQAIVDLATELGGKTLYIESPLAHPAQYQYTISPNHLLKIQDSSIYPQFVHILLLQKYPTKWES